MKDTLLLNADWTPLQVLGWQRALWLAMTDRVLRVQDYDGLYVRSEHLRIPWPAVVALTRQATPDASAVTLSRASILARDGFTCQYCGWSARTRSGRPVTEALTIDHVVPRAQAVRRRVPLPDGRIVPLHSWENIVTACRSCNLRKGARTPAEAGMTLRTVPRSPGPADVVRITFARVEVEREWWPFLPEDAGIRRPSRSAA